jgi:N-acetylmuramoyl-L-alanine amidase
MRWTRLAAALAGVLLLLPWILRSAEERKLAVFSRQAQFALPITEFDRALYIRLQDLLEKMGPVQSKADRRTIRLRLKDIEGEFQDGTNRIRVGPAVIKTNAPVLFHQGAVLLPINSLPLVLKYFGLGDTELHEPGRRLFIGDVQQAAAASLHRDAGTLVLEFPNPVNPKINAEGSKVQLVFTREPVVLNADRVDYTDKLIKSISYAEANGLAEITVEGTSPLLASLSNGGRVITFSAAPAPAVAAAPPPSEAPPAPPEVPPAELIPAVPAETPVIAPSPGTPAASAPSFVVMIDAAHGGNETGVRFSDKLLEKEITLAMAKRLQGELQQRGVATVLLRNDDSAISSDQRAVTANEKRPSVFVSLHAGGPGTGVRVYTALVAEADTKPGGLFVRWENAHAAYLARSRAVANAVVAELASKKITASMMPAAVSPLNTIAAPAIAIELAPPPNKPIPEGLTTAAYQSAVLEAAAAGILEARGRSASASEGKK